MPLLTLCPVFLTIFLTRCAGFDPRPKVHDLPTLTYAFLPPKLRSRCLKPLVLSRLSFLSWTPHQRLSGPSFSPIHNL